MSVTLVDVDATWVNPDTVQYDAGELRRADAAIFVTAGIARGLNDNTLKVSVDGSDVVTVQAGSWVIPGNAAAGSGVWRGGIAAAVTGTLPARDLTNARKDLIVARQLDTDVVGTHGAYTGRIEIIPGTPSATPQIPDFPSMAIELGRITVPKQGGGAASVDLSHRSFAAAMGGEIVAPTMSLLPSTAATGQRGYALDTGVSYRFNGTKWVGQLTTGIATLNTDATGTAILTHNLGFVPGKFLCTMRNSQLYAAANDTTATTSTIQVVVRNLADGTLFASQGAGVCMWAAAE